MVVAEHTEDGVRHPLVWWRPATAEHGAVVYDALGHGVESFESEPRRTWLRAAARRLIDSAAERRGNTT